MRPALSGSRIRVAALRNGHWGASDLRYEGAPRSGRVNSGETYDRKAPPQELSIGGVARSCPNLTAEQVGD
jgi:hypothetical protein